jgi:phage terminase large subunit
MIQNSDYVFKQTIAQKKAVETIINSSAKNICFEGGSRSGKSFEIMREIIVRASIADFSDHLICRETFNACKRSIWMKTMPDVFKLCFPEIKSRPLQSQGIYYSQLPNGSKIYLAGLDDDKKLERLLGTEYSTVWINETNQVPYPAVSKLKTRLAQKNSLIKKTYYDLNPTKTSSWVYQLFHQGVDPVEGAMVEDKDNYLTIKMNPEDNLENLDPDYIKMLNSLPEKEKMRFLRGEYDSENTGAAVYSFDQEQHVGEEAIRLPGTVIVGSDFNIEHNSDILCSRTSTQLYVWDEIQIPGDTFKKVDEIRKKGASGAEIISDSTGKNRSTKGKSDHHILRDAGFIVTPTFNPHVVDKIANLNRCFTLGLIKINPRCKKLIRDLIQLQWNKHGELDQKTDPSLSHLVDCLAYVCWKLYPLINMPKSSQRAL